MTKRGSSRAASLLLVVACLVGAACGGASSFGGADAEAGPPAVRPDAGGHKDGSSVDAGHSLGTVTLTGLSISPATATLRSINAAPATQPFSLVGRYSDGSSAHIASGSWLVDTAAVGAIDGNGLFTASGARGGVVTVSATANGQTASATLTVILELDQNPAALPSATQAALTGATTADASVVWAYPYDGTVWPRGLLPPVLQWNGGAATDDYCVQLTSPTFALTLFTAATGAPASQLAVDATTWEKFTDSTTGAAQLTVSRWDGTTATQVAKQTWTMAAGSMRGTIYYWSNDLGRVLRIQPGAAAPDDFANQPPLNDPTMFQQDSCLMTCHTVSADGSTLVSGGGAFGGSYNLKTGQPMHSLGGTWGVDPNTAGQPEWENIAWYQPALSPDGKYVLTNSMGQGGVTATSGPDTVMGLFLSADGSAVANSGVAGSPFAEPTWSPDGSKVAFVDSGDPSTWAALGGNWQQPPPGDLKVAPFDATANPMFSPPTTVVSVGTGARITWPTISPDGQWVLYSRGASADTRAGPGDLYLASTVTPNQEVRLAKVDGDGYPFAAGMRDLSLNYEPSFAPVAAGGYFWVVFTSRRTYGNTLTGQAFPCSTSPCSEVKQLWVAAIDQSPTPGKDPSHAAFHLTGQVEQNMAMRGFWSLPPCKADGQSCATGTDCCGGYCATGTDAGASSEGGAGEGGAGAVCRSTGTGCAASGDKCTTSGDCCGASSGTTCINHVCSEAAPK